jgi:signal peptidase II
MKKWLLVALLAGGIFAGDQATKFLAVRHLTTAFRADGVTTLSGELSLYLQKRDLRPQALPPSVVFPSFWQHRYTQNPGAAWGIFSGASEAVRVPFFHLVTIAAVVFLSLYVRRLSEEQRYQQVCAGLLLGGALGNGLDRLLHGSVIDFIDWHLADPNWLVPSHHWPTFNVADIGVSVGLTLLLLEAFLGKGPAQARQPERA